MGKSPRKFSDDYMKNRMIEAARYACPSLVLIIEDEWSDYGSIFQALRERKDDIQQKFIYDFCEMFPDPDAATEVLYDAVRKELLCGSGSLRDDIRDIFRQHLVELEELSDREVKNYLSWNQAKGEAYNNALNAGKADTRRAMGAMKELVEEAVWNAGCDALRGTPVRRKHREKAPQAVQVASHDLGCCAAWDVLKHGEMKKKPPRDFSGNPFERLKTIYWGTGVLIGEQKRKPAILTREGFDSPLPLLG